MSVFRGGVHQKAITENHFQPEGHNRRSHQKVITEGHFQPESQYQKVTLPLPFLRQADPIPMAVQGYKLMHITYTVRRHYCIEILHSTVQGINKQSTENTLTIAASTAEWLALPFKIRKCLPIG